MKKKALLVTRRNFIRNVFTVAGTVSLWPAVAAGSRSRQDRMIEKLTALINSKRSATEVGDAYLKNIGGQFSQGEMLQTVLKSLGGQSDVMTSSLAQLKQRLANASQQDFVDCNTVIVNGWVLSKTEASLCAVIALA